jgi:hypothetical protein
MKEYPRPEAPHCEIIAVFSTCSLSLLDENVSFSILFSNTLSLSSLT